MYVFIVFVARQLPRNGFAGKYLNPVVYSSGGIPTRAGRAFNILA
jgi:hypothetical protein